MRRRVVVRFMSLAVLLTLVTLTVVAPAAVTRAADAPVAAPAPAAVDAPNAVYMELIGTCVVGSFNYERRLGDAWPLRVGAGVIPPLRHTDQWVATPTATFGRLFGAGSHHLEVAAGVTAWLERSPGLLAAGVVGYRYQPPGPGVVIRAAFTPLVPLVQPGSATINQLQPSIGFSIGKAW